MGILAIDYGDKRTGFAIELEGIAIPKEIVKREFVLKKIKDYINIYNITIIVVGLPYDLYGNNIKQLEKTRKFIRELKNKFKSVKIEGVDERYTTFEAERILESIGINETKGKKDAISAALILETYINKIKN